MDISNVSNKITKDTYTINRAKNENRYDGMIKNTKHTILWLYVENEQKIHYFPLIIICIEM